MLTYWMELFSASNQDSDTSGQFRWPERSDIQPAACRHLLGDMFILQEGDNASNYRLAGTRLCAMFGRELKRETFSNTFVPIDRKLANNWVANMGRDDYLVLLCTQAHTAQGHAINLETLLMPLMHNGVANSRTVGICVPESRPGWLGMIPLVSQRIKSVRVIRPWEKNSFKANWPFEMHENLVREHGGVTVTPPALFKENRNQAIAPELDGGDFQETGIRKVGHLTVFDGGRD